MTVCLCSPCTAANTFRFTFPGYKLRAFTMAYDDGLIFDKNMIEILNKYGIKATFYLSAGRAGKTERFLTLDDYATVYTDHEIGSHGYQHVAMHTLNKQETEDEIKKDLAALEKVTKKPIVCFACPYGSFNPLEADILRENGLLYARTTGDSRRTTNIWQDFIYWHPTCHHDADIDKTLLPFLAKDAYGGCLKLFTCWGHSYEFNSKNNWERLEDICQKVSQAKNVLWLATNGEIFDYLNACQQVISTIDGKCLINPTATTIYYIERIDGKDQQKILQPAIIPTEPIVPNITYPEGSYLVFPGGRKKALTFSYDDGSPEPDAKLAAIFNQYNVKATFNVCSKNVTDYSIYNGHEIAGHSFNHTYFSLLPKPLALHDIYADKANIESHTGIPVRGYAYPNGDGPCYCQAQVEILKSLNIEYARGTEAAKDFSLPDNWYNWSGNTRNVNPDFLEMADKFIAEEKAPALLYVWGHSFEMIKDWSVMTNFLDKIANRNDIWYATNIQIHDYVEAARKLRWAQDKSFVYNPTATPIYYVVNGKLTIIEPGKQINF